MPPTIHEVEPVTPESLSGKSLNVLNQMHGNMRAKLTQKEREKRSKKQINIIEKNIEVIIAVKQAEKLREAQEHASRGTKHVKSADQKREAIGKEAEIAASALQNIASLTKDMEKDHINAKQECPDRPREILENRAVH